MKFKYYLSSQRVCFVLFCLFLILIAVVSSVYGAVPDITAHNNTKTNIDSWAVVAKNEVIGFNITATGATSYDWLVDGASQSWNYPNFTTSFTDTFGSPYHVKGLAISVDGQDSYEYRIGISKTTGNTQITALNTSAYNSVRNATKDYNFKDFIGATITPYTNVTGNVFYLFLYLGIFSAYWIRQKSITIPSVLGLISGGAVIGMLPEEYQPIAIAIIMVSGGALLAKIYLESR